MNEETTVPETEADDFTTGFTGEAPTTTPEAPTETPAPVEDAVAEPVAEAAPEPEPEFVQLTKAELEELRGKAEAVDGLKDDLHRKVSSVFGKLGVLEQQLGQLKQTGRKVEITDEMLADTGLSEYPEVAEGVRKLLGKAIEGAIVAEAPTIGQEKIDEIRAKVREELAVGLIEDRHPGYTAIIAAPEFAAWRDSQTPERAAEIKSVSNPFAAIKMLDEYKAHREAIDAEKRKQETAAAARQKRIEAAVAPRGTGGVAPVGRTEDDEFALGFNGG